VAENSAIEAHAVRRASLSRRAGYPGPFVLRGGRRTNRTLTLARTTGIRSRVSSIGRRLP
jgi:hypothetical protein